MIVYFSMSVSLPSTWEQTPEELTVSVTVLAGTPDKLIKCQITKDDLTVGIKGQSPIVDGPLSGPVRSSQWC
jgi:hypothetical protein